MKKEYKKPIMECELFTANEFVAACYKINCKTPRRLGQDNGGWRYLYDDTNKNGVLDKGDKQLMHYFATFTGCGKEHVGVIMDEAPKVNGFVTSVEKNFIISPSTQQAEVFWWKESLGTSSDYHVMTPGEENYETNPNAS